MKNLMKVRSYIASNKTDILAISVLLTIAGVVHSWNMFHYPTFFDDEGTYISQAQSFINYLHLAPYTYWYDHAPAGWIIIGLWLKLSTPFTHGITPLESGRVLMLVVHMFSALVVYLITKKISSSNFGAILATLFYALSPLGISLGRTIFLDNIMVLLILISFWMILVSKRLLIISLGGAIFGLALLCKETAPFLLPGFLVAIFISIESKRRVHAIVLWLISMASIVALYPIYALMKNEFFVSGGYLGGKNPHVSLLGSLIWQSSRKGGFFLDHSSQFYFSLTHSWLTTDPLLIYAGVVSLILILFIPRRNNWGFRLSITTLGFGYAFYLIRGGIINDQYIIPLLSILAIAIGIACALLSDYLKQYRVNIALRGTFAILVLAIVMGNYSTKLDPYISDQTSAQMKAENWLKSNVHPADGVIVVDGYTLGDLLNTTNGQNASYGQFQHYWKIDNDNAVSIGTLHGDYESIGYILATSRMLRDVQIGNLPLVKAALAHATLVASFKNEEYAGSLAEFNQAGQGQTLIAESGFVGIYKVNSREKNIQQDDWAAFKAHNVISYGQVLDNNKTKNSSLKIISGALSNAVQQNDKAEFDGIMQWSTDHLQHRAEDKLLSSTWVSLPDGTEGVGVSEADVSANAELAATLLQAADTWKIPSYKTTANIIITELWRQHSSRIGNKIYLVRANGLDNTPVYVDLHTLRMISAADKAHPWSLISDSEYELLASQSFGSPLLTPILTVSANGTLGTTNNGVDEASLSRIASDLANEATVANDPRAKTLLNGLSGYFQIHLPINATYFRDGSVATGQTTGLAATAEVFSQLALLQDSSYGTYQKYIAPNYDAKGSQFAPYSNAGLQLALNGLLTRADALHVSLVNRPK